MWEIRLVECGEIESSVIASDGRGNRRHVRNGTFGTFEGLHVVFAAISEVQLGS